MHKYNWDTHTARLAVPNDTSTVAVIDGGELFPPPGGQILQRWRADERTDKVLITPFRTQNTPPPMASYTLTLPAPARHLSLSHSTDQLAVLLSDADGTVQVYDLRTRLPVKGGKRGGGKAAEPQLLFEVKTKAEGGDGLVLKQVCMGSAEAATGAFAVLANNAKGGSTIVQYSNGQETGRDECAKDIQRVVWDAELGYLLLEESGVLSSCESSSKHPVYRLKHSAQRLRARS